MPTNPYTEANCYGLPNREYNECKSQMNILASQWTAQQQAAEQIAKTGLSPAAKGALIIGILVFVGIIIFAIYKKFKK